MSGCPSVPYLIMVPRELFGRVTPFAKPLGALSFPTTKSCQPHNLVDWFYDASRWSLNVLCTPRPLVSKQCVHYPVSSTPHKFPRNVKNVHVYEMFDVHPLRMLCFHREGCCTFKSLASVHFSIFSRCQLYPP